MIKRIIRSLPSVLLFILCTYVIVYAGTTGDVGQLQDYPPIGEANWTAWITETKNILSGGMPNEVITEDNTNSALGEDNGYSFFGTADTIPDWVLQIINLSNESNGDNVQMNFGGLGNSSGKLWFHNFDWTQAEYLTFHGTIPLSTTGEACPIISEVYTDTEEHINYVSFRGVPGYYHVYRSQNGSGANNGASNGRYFWIASVDTDTNGVQTYMDYTDQESWYIVIQADPTTNAPIGCHSEMAEPTSATLTNFTASYDLLSAQVNLSWETTNQIDMLGFNVLRQAPGEQAPAQINQHRIDVYQPGSSMGGVFGFVDTDVVFGSDYQYWIEVVETDNLTSRFGPVGVTSGYNVFIPLMKK